MFLVVFTLFAFLVMNIVKAALITNFKLLEMMQIMGASSIELAKSISQSLIRRILPGALLSLIFVFFISVVLINLFGANFEFFDSNFSKELIISSFFILIIFLIFFTLLFFIFLTFYLFNFLKADFLINFKNIFFILSSIILLGYIWWLIFLFNILPKNYYSKTFPTVVLRQE